VLRMLGPGDLAWRLFDLAWLAVGVAAVFAFASAWGRVAAATGAIVFALYHLAGGPWQAGQRDFLLCPLLVAGALGAARWVEARRRSALAWGGLALGASITIKPHTLSLVVALAVVLVVAAWRAHESAVAPLAQFAGAVALLPMAVVVWLALAGALPAWRAIVFDYLVPLYSRLGGGAACWSIYRPWAWAPLVTGAILSVASALQGGRFRARHALAALGVLYGVAHVVGQGKGWEYHFYPLAAFTALLLVAEVEPALARWRGPASLALLLSVVLTVSLLAGKAAAAGDGWERDKATRTARIARDLAWRLRAGDTVQVLDTTEGGLHALLRLGVRQPTRFLYDFHFFHDVGHPTIEALRAELIRDLDARPPGAIVVFELAWPGGGYARLATFPELAARLARYDLVEPGPGYRIYARRNRP
jgi:hypothetical protein